MTLRLCRLLARLPGWAFREDGTDYTANEVGIFYGAIGADPDRAIGVRVYGTTDEDISTRRAQLRIRGAKYQRVSADRLADLAKTVLHGLSRVGGINDIRRISMTPLGADNNGREERTENYEIILDNPEASS
nr:minor capsid protein [Microbacterium sp. CFH 90308]